MLFYNLGRYSAAARPPVLRVEEPAIDLTQIYDSLKTAAGQPQVAGDVAQSAATADDAAECGGRIKGNISSSSKIYHLPGGVFYERTNPEMCFDTEAQAQAAGFRKSQR